MSGFPEIENSTSLVPSPRVTLILPITVAPVPPYHSQSVTACSLLAQLYQTNALLTEWLAVQCTKFTQLSWLHSNGHCVNMEEVVNFSIILSKLLLKLILFCVFCLLRQSDFVITCDGIHLLNILIIQLLFRCYFRYFCTSQSTNNITYCI